MQLKTIIASGANNCLLPGCRFGIWFQAHHLITWHHRFLSGQLLVTGHKWRGLFLSILGRFIIRFKLLLAPRFTNTYSCDLLVWSFVFGWDYLLLMTNRAKVFTILSLDFQTHFGLWLLFWELVLETYRLCYILHSKSTRLVSLKRFRSSFLFNDCLRLKDFLWSLDSLLGLDYWLIYVQIVTDCKFVDRVFK